jgi:hypothetical protein
MIGFRETSPETIKAAAATLATLIYPKATAAVA